MDPVTIAMIGSTAAGAISPLLQGKSDLERLQERLLRYKTEWMPQERERLMKLLQSGGFYNANTIAQLRAMHDQSIKAGLGDYLRMYGRGLSGGEQARVIGNLLAKQYGGFMQNIGQQKMGNLQQISNALYQGAFG